MINKIVFSCIGMLLGITTICNAQQKPNILIIHTDDLGYHDLSFTGSQLYNTPNIDQLARESVSFTNAYSSYPRCTPSRYGMITGTYPLNENKGDLSALPDQQNFAKLFNKAGYHTMYIGKWHLGGGKRAPKKIGWENSYAAGATGGADTRFYPFNTKSAEGKGHGAIPDVTEDGKEGDYLSDVLTNRAIKFIEENPKDEPFMAVLAFYAVHTPIEAKDKDVERNKKELKNIDFGDTPEFIEEGYGRRKMRQDDPVYAGMVENVDENVGRLLQKLKELGIEENTIIVFSSDHGGLSNDGFKRERHLATTNNPLRAGKGWLYEGGIRVPLFIKYPKELKAHEDHESIVLGMDVFPTLLDLATGDKVKGIDGKSYAEVLKENQNWKDRTVFWHSRKARPHSTGDVRTSVVRSGDYKLIDFYGDDMVQLYNLKDDPSESNDLAIKMPEKTDALKKLLAQWKENYNVKDGKDRVDVMEKRMDKRKK